MKPTEQYGDDSLSISQNVAVSKLGCDGAEYLVREGGKIVQYEMRRGGGGRRLAKKLWAVTEHNWHRENGQCSHILQGVMFDCCFTS